MLNATPLEKSRLFSIIEKIQSRFHILYENWNSTLQTQNNEMFLELVFYHGIVDNYDSLKIMK